MLCCVSLSILPTRPACALRVVTIVAVRMLEGVGSRASAHLLVGLGHRAAPTIGTGDYQPQRELAFVAFAAAGVDQGWSVLPIGPVGVGVRNANSLPWSKFGIRALVGFAGPLFEGGERALGGVLPGLSEDDVSIPQFELEAIALA